MLVVADRGCFDTRAYLATIHSSSPVRGTSRRPAAGTLQVRRGVRRPREVKVVDGAADRPRVLGPVLARRVRIERDAHR